MPRMSNSEHSSLIISLNQYMELVFAAFLIKAINNSLIRYTYRKKSNGSYNYLNSDQSTIHLFDDLHQHITIDKGIFRIIHIFIKNRNICSTLYMLIQQLFIISTEDHVACSNDHIRIRCIFNCLHINIYALISLLYTLLLLISSAVKICSFPRLN